MVETNQGNWGYAIVGMTTVMVILAIVFVSARVATRIWISKSFWWDDVTIILALLGTIIGAALDYVEVSYGFGRHQQFLTPHELKEFMKYTYGEWIQTFASLMWTKVSICLFLMRIPNSKALILPLQIAVCFLILSNVVLTVIWIVQCQPLHAAWDKDIPGTCLHRGGLEGIILAQALISCISDFAFASYPILILWRVQLKFKTKVGLCCLMGLGVLTGVCCIVRTALNSEALPLDASYNGIVNWMWRLFEVQIGIIAACIPTLPIGYKWLVGKASTIRSSHRSNSEAVPFNRTPNSWPSESTKVSHPTQARSKLPVPSDGTTDLSLIGSKALPIMKTTQWDVEKQAGEKREMKQGIGGGGGGLGHGRNTSDATRDGKPSLDVDIHPSFEHDSEIRRVMSLR